MTVSEPHGPYLVATENGSVLEYASFGDFRPFDGYRLSVEHSVYVGAAVRRRGVASVLMRRLISRAREAGKHVMVAGIESETTASIELHRSLGFALVGRLPQAGCKFGRWLDLTWMTLQLDRRSNP